MLTTHLLIVKKLQFNSGYPLIDSINNEVMFPDYPLNNSINNEVKFVDYPFNNSINSEVKFVDYHVSDI